MSQQLTKLKIEAFKDIECSQFIRAFEVMFNPTTYSQKYEIDYENEQGAGTTGNTQKFGSIKPKDYSFEFVIDGTGASAEPVDVSEVLDDFLTTAAKMDGDIHRPPFLKLSWGDLIATCVLKSADISYTLFNPDGKPLRVKINASFSENIPDEQRVAEEGKNSPDLTHVRTVNEGDYLSLMSDVIYKDFSFYYQIAQANELNNFRKLKTGSSLKFPPLVSEKVSK
jgi:hypothetical protein